VEKLRHKNEAIKAINSKIGNVDGALSDELVGTVATLTSFEVRMSVQYMEIRIHLFAVEPVRRL
jgi:hypothetical protein